MAALIGSKTPPLVAHIIFRLAVGGLENGLTNLINNMPPHRYRHAIISLTECTDFSERLRRDDVVLISLHKQSGHDFQVYARLLKTLTTLRPAIVHTRNLPALESLVPAALAGVPCRLHGEQGRDVYDPDGLNRKYNLLRKIIRPLVHCYTTVSQELAEWLVRTVGAKPERVKHIYNGVDLDRFHPAVGLRESVGPGGFAPSGTLVIGTVGRMEPIKDQLTLVRAFLHLIKGEPGLRQRLRIIVVGAGSLRNRARELLDKVNAGHLAWLPGERNDIPQIMRGLDVFVLPSLREGVSNTILEAMATGLPVVATRVGGNPELVEDGVSGTLVPHSDPASMAEAIRRYSLDPRLRREHGRAGRKKAEERFSIQKMIEGYLSVYDAVLDGKKHRRLFAHWHKADSHAT